MRSTLVAALVSCSDRPAQPGARRFLKGLSSDELQFIAGFVGARILESAEGERIVDYPQSCDGRAEDLEDKIILLREYLCRSKPRRRITGRFRRRRGAPV